MPWRESKDSYANGNLQFHRFIGSSLFTKEAKLRPQNIVRVPSMLRTSASQKLLPVVLDVVHFKVIVDWDREARNKKKQKEKQFKI